MSNALQIALAFASVAVLLGLMAVVKAVSGRMHLSAELQRKIVHIGTGLYALTLPWLFPEKWPVYMLVGVTIGVMLVLRLPRVAASGIGATLHGVDRQSYGDILLAISVGLCLFLAEDQLYLYMLPIAVLTLADAAAALGGTTYGRRFFRVEDGQKSIEGSVIFFVTAFMLALVCLMLMTPLPPLNIIFLALMVAGFGTLVEASSWRGFDNLFLPLGLLVFLAVYADRSLADLMMLAALFAGTLVLFRAVAPAVGLTNHAGRVYVTTVFLLLAVTALHNAILPVSVLLAHVWCRAVNPGKANYPDLDVVAAIICVSLFWLTLGTALGWNAITFYGLTALGMTMGFCVLALSPRALPSKLFGIVVVAAVLLAIRTGVMTLNEPMRNWNGDMMTEALISLLLIIAITSLHPKWFVNARVSKLTGLAMVVPLGSYLWGTGVLKDLA